MTGGTVFDIGYQRYTGEREGRSRGRLAIFKDGLSAIALLGWMLYLNWKLTLLSLALTPAIILVVKTISVRRRKLTRPRSKC